MKRRILTLAIVALLGTNIMVSAALAEDKKPVEVSADSLEYNSSTGVITAQGKVVIKQDNATITGVTAQYNMKNKEAHIFGDVKLVKEDIKLVADEVQSFDNNHIVASGESLLLTKGTDSLKALKLDYYTDKEYACTSGGFAELVMNQGRMSADKIEAFFAENKALGTGNVHIISDANNLDAISDYAEYYSAQNGETGRVILSGNARANQDGNILTGNKLTLYMGDKAADAEGRAKLVIKPGE